MQAMGLAQIRRSKISRIAMQAINMGEKYLKFHNFGQSTKLFFCGENYLKTPEQKKKISKYIFDYHRKNQCSILT